MNSAVTKPILEVSEVARQVMASRDFSLRAKKTTQDEIGSLVDGFNDMLAEIGRRAEIMEASHRALAQAEDNLHKLNAELEQRVTDRTAQLEAANKELESFSYSVSHDLRAPVRAIAGFSKMLWDMHGDKLDAEAKRKLGIIQSETQRMGNLIDDLLAFSRLGRQEMQRVELDMQDMARNMYERLRLQHQGPEVEFRLGSLPRARGDRVLLEQVWANLLSNALKFSAKKEKPVIEVSAISDDKEHTYFVRDNGAGFDPQYQSKLFGVFQRLHRADEFAGTGVGLALVHRIVTRHGGRIWADSRPHEGATFYFTLPREQADGNH
jgi:light-regulated signal transduction histidine kinase (bacteriophytochrome)